MADSKGFLQAAFSGQKTDAMVAVAVICVVMMLIVPLPAPLLDFLMAINLILSLLILLIVLYTKRAIDFSIFPTMLLVSTVFGLSLNVSSTRLILTQGVKFKGQMVRAFSTFVTGTDGSDGLLIGFVIFVILVVVQAMVITKGAGRVAEVAARFTLDGMPTKMMEVESERSSGAISDEDAKKRKIEIQMQSDFYGSMDGASKFVSGNVKVGIVITVINLLVGLILGMVLRGEPFAEAIKTYAALTIGDGLLSQLPSLMVSVATGIIVTRAVSDQTFGKDLKEQFLRDSKIYYIAAAVLILMAFLPGFPTIILIIIAGLLIFLAWRMSLKEAASFRAELAKAGQKDSKADEGKPGKVAPIALLDPLSLELGYSLVPLVDKNGELVERISSIRQEMALELGLTIPSVRIIDNLRIEPGEYRFKIKGSEIGRGSIRMGAFLCINPGGALDDIPGENTVDPTFGIPAKWISADFREKAERNGFTVIDPPSIIATHITEMIKQHAAEILGRQEVQAILDTVKRDYAAVVDEVMNSASPGHLTLGQIQKVLQCLLEEQVSIRNMVVILETLSDYAVYSKDVYLLVEKVRQALCRQICLQYADDDQTLHVLTIDPSLEQRIIDSREETSEGPIPAMDYAFRQNWIRAVSDSFKSVRDKGYWPMILCSEAARLLIRRSAERDFPGLVVLSSQELVRGIKAEALGVIKLE